MFLREILLAIGSLRRQSLRREAPERPGTTAGRRYCDRPRAVTGHTTSTRPLRMPYISS